jgi:hypothetical protein
MSAVAGATALTVACADERGPRVRSSPPPAQLIRSEELAEDIQDDVQSGGWAAAEAKRRRLEADMPSLHPVGRVETRGPTAADGNPAAESLVVPSYRSALDSLRVQLVRHGRLAALVSANAVSRMLLQLKQGYAARPPVAVGVLDVAGRDFLYRVEGARWVEAGGSIAELRHAYASLRDHVAHSDPPLDSRIEDELSRLRAAVVARNEEEAGRAGRAFLEDVDAIERTY